MTIFLLARLLTAAVLFLCANQVTAQEASVPLPVTISVQPGARQTFQGLGASIFPWTPAAAFRAQVSPAQNEEMARQLWHDARLRSVRLWIHPGEEPLDFYVDGYVGTGKLPAAMAAGATNLLLAPDHIPPRMGDTGDHKGYIKASAIPEYADLLADFIRDFRGKTGILINFCGILNEPNDRPVKFSDTQWPVMVKDLRRSLDTHGLQTVKIIAPESANCGADAYAVVDSLKADSAAWNALAGVATHSYNNAATEDMAERAAGKEYWTTEAGGITDSDEDAHDALQAASAASRFLNDVNYRVTDWQFFIGYEQADPHGNTGRILKYDVNPFRLTVLQKYFYLQQLAQAFDVGAVFRHSRSSLEGEMTYTYGKKPRINAAVAKNPDGTWAIGLSNYTSSTFQDADDPNDFALHNSGYHAQTFAVHVIVPELASLKTLRFFVRHSTGIVGNQPGGFIVMHFGQATISVQPLELVTLRSLRGSTH